MLKTAWKRLENGLPALLLQLDHVHSVSCALLVKTGPRYERPDHNGVSHVVEHLLFRGTRAHPSSLAFHTAVEALGGEINGLTQRDATTVHITVPPARWVEGLALLGEVCTQPLLEGLNVERDVVIEEILDTCDGDGNDLDIDTVSRRILWSDHPMSMPVAGTVEHVERFTPQMCRRRFERTFVATNAVLVVAGPVSPDALWPAAERAFGAMPEGRPMPEPLPPMPTSHPAIHVQPTDDAQVSVLLTFPAPPEGHPDFTKLLLLRRLLDDGFGARLRQAICEQRGLAYSLGVSIDVYKDAGAIDLELSCAPGKLIRAVERMLLTLRELVHEPVSSEELERVKTRHLADLEFSLDDPGELSGWYGAAQLLGLSVDYTRRHEEIRAIQPQDLLRLARELFDSDRALLTLVGPVEEDHARRLELLLQREHGSTFWFEQTSEEAAEPPAQLELVS